jgi:hypothetical protein
MTESIVRCPICGKIVALGKDRMMEQLEPVHGICYEFGYSMGGWGRCQNFITPFSGEVCNDCFNALKHKIDELKEVFDQRRDSCKEGICIYKTSANRATGNNVPDVRDDELQPERHKSPLLRLLSSFSQQRALRK